MKKKLAVVAIFLAVMVTGGTVWAAVDMFLNIAGVPGESLDIRHRDEIEVLSWSWGATVPVTTSIGGGGTAGRPNIEGLTITKPIDKATVPLYVDLAVGRHIPSMILTLVKPGAPFDFFKIKLIDVLVTSMQSGGATGDLRMTDTITFTAGRFELTYIPQNPDGTLGGTVAGTLP